MNRVLIAESGSGYGGSAKYLASLLPLLDRSRFSIEIVTCGDGPFIQQIKEEGYSLHYQPSWRFSWGELSVIPARFKRESVDPRLKHMRLCRSAAPLHSGMTKLIYAFKYVFLSLFQLMVMVPTITIWLKRHRIQLVHLNNEILSHLPLVLAARFSGCKILCHFHGWRKLISTERIVSRLVNSFIAVTQSGADFYSWQLDGREVVGIPNGLLIHERNISRPEVRRETRKKLGFVDQDVVALIVGRFIPLKGHSVFLRAIHNAIQEDLNIKALIVGTDPSPASEFREKLESEVVQLGLQDRVQFLPWQDHMGPIYEASDVVLQPSIEAESFGYVALEGMSMGKPVIASRIGGLIDVVSDGETGFLVEPGDSDKLAQAILKIVKNPTLAFRLGENGRERVKKLFTMEHNAAEVQEIYERMLKRQEISGKGLVLIAESGSGYGGTAKYLAGVLPLLNNGNWSIEIVSYGKGPFIQQIGKSGITFHFRPHWFFPWGEEKEIKGKRQGVRGVVLNVCQTTFAIVQLFVLVPLIAFWLKCKKYKLVHLNNDMRSHLPLLIAAHFAGCRILCHFHGWRSLTLAERWFVRFVDEFVAISEAGAKFFNEDIKTHRVIVIPNGLSVNGRLGSFEEKRNQERRSMGIKSDAKVVTIVGRLVPWKGHEVYLKALAKVVHKNPNVAGLILGHDSTPDQSYLKKLQNLTHKLGLTSKVQFMPWQEDVWSVYAASDIVVHASIEPEPFGLVILEAMFAKRPVIATKGGGVSDLVIDGESGYLIEPNQVDDLANAIERLAHDSELTDRLAERGQERARSLFTMERNAAKVADVYERLLVCPKPEKGQSLFAMRGLRSALKQTMLSTGTVRLMRYSLRTKVPVVMYHRISRDPDPFFPAVSAKVFEKQMEYIKHAYHVISLDELIGYWAKGEEAPSGSLAVTFDDGDACAWSLAYPVLKKFEIPITVFLASGPTEENGFIWTDLLRWQLKLTQKNKCSIDIDGCRREWALNTVQERLNALTELSRILKTVENKHREIVMEQMEEVFGVKRSNFPERWLLTPKQVKSLQKDQITFGAHTMTHPILSRMPLAEARYEIFESKKHLEKILNEKVRHFAYPNGEAGDFTQEHEQLVLQAGFDSACSTILGLNDHQSNRYALRRVYASEEPLASFASRLVGLGS